ncbi:hypothetical protein P4S80_09860 [Aeribacillus composti]|uniref:hypothetical protein n=1 Tax=Aeribacillus TaxID=1055323 RepID=UPI002E2315C9|nr:hypothetical protein [Aeribacillus composti]MED0746219.1 hypothetical protein [Aeribacillus composti]
MTLKKDSEIEAVLQELEKPEQIESMHYLVKKLPELTAAIQSVEEKIEFISYTLHDKKSLTNLVNQVEEKVESLHLTKEHLETIITMMQMLPRLVQLLGKAEELLLFVQNVITDSQSVEYALKCFKDIVPMEKGLHIIKETNERFKNEKDTSHVSLLRMYRLLKNPAVQNGFKYLEALLEVINKQSK